MKITHDTKNLRTALNFKEIAQISGVYQAGGFVCDFMMSSSVENIFVMLYAQLVIDSKLIESGINTVCILKVPCSLQSACWIVVNYSF